MALARVFAKKKPPIISLFNYNSADTILRDLDLICCNSCHYGIANSKSLTIIKPFYVFLACKTIYADITTCIGISRNLMSKITLSGLCDSRTSTHPHVKFQVI